jgi:hypothetical protein
LEPLTVVEFLMRGGMNREMLDVAGGVGDTRRGRDRYILGRSATSANKREVLHYKRHKTKTEHDHFGQLAVNSETNQFLIYWTTVGVGAKHF